MEIIINGTQVLIKGDRIIGFALNNLVNTLVATSDLDNTWNYKLYVHMVVPNLYNIIDLTWQEGTQNVYVDLTADMLPFSGKYEMQFVASKGDIVGRTDIFEVWVKNSIDPSKFYDPVPSEFYQVQNNIEELNSHPPYPGNQGYWMIWNVNTNSYQTSTLPVGGGGVDKTYVFTQTVPSSNWFIKHDLNKFPSVSIVDSGNNSVIGEVNYIDENNVEVIFQGSFSGKAYLN